MMMRLRMSVGLGGSRGILLRIRGWGGNRSGTIAAHSHHHHRMNHLIKPPLINRADLVTHQLVGLVRCGWRRRLSVVTRSMGLGMSVPVVCGFLPQEPVRC